MKIAVTATEASLDAAVDPRFGRCRWFVVVDAEQETFESLENANAAASSGAGIQSAQMLATSGADVVLTGNCGPNAVRTLSAAGIQVVCGCSGTVREVVQQFKAGQLQPTAEPSVESHFGMGNPASEAPEAVSSGGPPESAGRGQGMGRGRGMGWGGGSGPGGRRGRGRGRGGGR